MIDVNLSNNATDSHCCYCQYVIYMNTILNDIFTSFYLVAVCLLCTYLISCFSQVDSFLYSCLALESNSSYKWIFLEIDLSFNLNPFMMILLQN